MQAREGSNVGGDVATNHREGRGSADGGEVISGYREDRVLSLMMRQFNGGKRRESSESQTLCKRLPPQQKELTSRACVSPVMLVQQSSTSQTSWPTNGVFLVPM